MQWIWPAQERSVRRRRPHDGVARARRPVVRLGAVAVLSVTAVGLGVVGGRPAAPAAAAPAAAEAAATTDPVVTRHRSARGDLRLRLDIVDVGGRRLPDDMAKATENPATGVGWTLIARAICLPKP